MKKVFFFAIMIAFGAVVNAQNGLQNQTTPVPQISQNPVFERSVPVLQIPYLIQVPPAPQQTPRPIQRVTHVHNNTYNTYTTAPVAPTQDKNISLQEHKKLLDESNLALETTLKNWMIIALLMALGIIILYLLLRNNTDQVHQETIRTVVEHVHNHRHDFNVRVRVINPPTPPAPPTASTVEEEKK